VDFLEIKVDVKRIKSLVSYQELARGTCGGVDFTLNIASPPAAIFMDFDDARYELGLRDFVQAVVNDRKKKQKEILVVSR